MMPYVSAFGLKNTFNPISTGLVMHLPQNLYNTNPIQLPVNINNNLTTKDSQWLTLEVCREFQRALCPRSDLECKFAHPPPFLETSGGRVMCCYDSMKGKCHRLKPPCKYFHPPQHLKDILIQNGKNNLLMKNLQMNILHQQLSTLPGSQQPRLGLIGVNPSGEAQTWHASEAPNLTPTFTISSNEILNLSNYVTKAEPAYSIESQTLQSSSTSISSGSTAQTPELRLGKKRSSALISQSADISLQRNPEEHTQMKVPKTSEDSLQGMQLYGNQQISRLGFWVNPLGSILPLNNDTALQNSGLNMPTILSNTHQGLSIAPRLVCPNSPMNNLAVINHIQNHQHLAMILNAGSNFLGNSGLTEFLNYK